MKQPAVTAMPTFFAAICSAWLITAPQTALAIPVFANGQGGVSCGLCHSSVPQLNSYGRYVLMTNFSKGLNKHLQMMQNRSLPVALEVTGNGSNQNDPMLPSVYNAITQFLTGGFIGSDVSYFSSVPVVTGGFPADAVDQVWVAYNGFSHGNGSLQVGKFPTPVFAPWISQPLSLSGYAPAMLPVGLNASTLADNRFGASYTQVGHRGLIGNVSYLTGAGAIERAFSSTGEGTVLTGSIQYLSPESRWSGGIAALRGTYPLPSGARDKYTRQSVLVSYGSTAFGAMAMDVLGRDANPNDSASPAATSHGFSFESIYGPLPWLHVDLQYEHTNDGLGNMAINYVTDAVFSIRPNVVLTVEDAASVGKRPSLSYQVLFAGPWYPDRFPPGTVAPLTPVPVSNDDSRSIANGRAIFLTGEDLQGVRIATSDPSRFYQSCAVCHNPDGAGGVELADGAISAKLGARAHMLDQMGSGATMDKKVTPWTPALMERTIADGIDNEGQSLSPVMPRWKMSKRDLHDIAMYVLTQLH